MRESAIVLTLLGSMLSPLALSPAKDLSREFVTPPHASKPWIYWWWLNGYVSKEGIVRDLNEMREQGISGALVFHAGKGATPKSNEFLSPEWRGLFSFAVEEAARRKITIGLNLCDGWNAGGPWVELEDAAKTLTHETVRLTGPQTFDRVLPKPAKAGDTYHDVAVLAWPIEAPTGKAKTLPQQERNPAGRYAPCRSPNVRDLTHNMDAAGRLVWQVPQGDWLVVRFGWQVHPRAYTKLTGGERHLEIDPLRAAAMDKHFAMTAGVVLEDVRAHAEKTFKYLHIDSGEIGEPDWTQTFRSDFQQLRGYDPFPYLAVKAGHIVDSSEVTERFLEDYEQTIGDLMIACYYGRLSELARQRGLSTHSEAAGYQKPTVDALGALACNDICMSEYWSRRSQSDPYIHQLAASQLRYHDGIKTASSAAHTYGRRIVQAEAFTVMRQVNYDRDPFALKDIGDRAFCAGLNRNVLCFYISQAEERSKPGYVWPGVGMEFDRHVTWWPMSSAWLTYLARCQHLLQAGQNVADICYFRGEWVPDYVPARWAMDPPLPLGLDCDTINAGALTSRAAVAEDGRMCLPDGQAYRYLVLWQGGRWQRPPREIFSFSQSPGQVPSTTCPAEGSGMPLAISPATLRKLKSLVEAGITLVGPRPKRAIGLAAYPESDSEVNRLADAMWGNAPGTVGRRKVGKGRVIWGQNLPQVMQADGILPNLEIVEAAETQALPPETLSGIPHPSSFDWIHRRTENADLYFIANLRNAPTVGDFYFRISRKQPELWDPVTGETRDLPDYRFGNDSRTSISLKFAPRQSFFVVFRRSVVAAASSGPPENFPTLTTIGQIDGPWEVRFDPRWGGPGRAVFERLRDWTTRPEVGIKHYSGTATYRCTFDLPARSITDRLYLDLGLVHNLARIHLNDVDLGIVWTAPWHVDVTRAVRSKGNILEIEVVNLWWNRLVGDASLPSQSRMTTSNASHLFNAEMPLLPSGLLGPMTLKESDELSSNQIPLQRGDSGLDERESFGRDVSSKYN